MTVLFTLRCDRRRHVVVEVVEEDGVRWVKVPLFAAGRNRSTWRPERFVLDGGGRRYGCKCGNRGWVIYDQALIAAIADGHREQFLQ